jgi:hypothetical protein
MIPCIASCRHSAWQGAVTKFDSDELERGQVTSWLIVSAPFCVAWLLGCTFEWDVRQQVECSLVLGFCIVFGDRTQHFFVWSEYLCLLALVPFFGLGLCLVHRKCVICPSSRVKSGIVVSCTYIIRIQCSCFTKDNSRPKHGTKPASTSTDTQESGNPN